MWRGQASTNKQASAGTLDECDSYYATQDYLRAVNVAWEAYERLIARCVAREQARMVLPMATMTAFYASVDLHNLLHFCVLRCKPDAQQEIRELAEKCLEHARKVAPISVRAWEEFCR